MDQIHVPNLSRTEGRRNTSRPFLALHPSSTPRYSGQRLVEPLQPHWNSNKNDWRGRRNKQCLLLLWRSDQREEQAQASPEPRLQNAPCCPRPSSPLTTSSSPNDPLRATPSPWLPHHDRLMRMYNRRSVFFPAITPCQVTWPSLYRKRVDLREPWCL